MRHSLVKKAIMPSAVICVAILITALVIVIQAIVAYVIESKTVVAENVICPATSVEEGKQGGFFGSGGIQPNVKVNCNGKEYAVDDAKLVIAYLLKPRPFSCTIYKTKDFSCRLAKDS